MERAEGGSRFNHGWAITTVKPVKLILSGGHGVFARDDVVDKGKAIFRHQIRKDLVRRPDLQANKARQKFIKMRRMVAVKGKRKEHLAIHAIAIGGGENEIKRKDVSSHSFNMIIHYKAAVVRSIFLPRQRGLSHNGESFLTHR